jgi:hypothetical protein
VSWSFPQQVGDRYSCLKHAGGEESGASMWAASNRGSIILSDYAQGATGWSGAPGSRLPDGGGAGWQARRCTPLSRAAAFKHVRFAGGAPRSNRGVKAGHRAAEARFRLRPAGDHANRDRAADPGQAEGEDEACRAELVVRICEAVAGGRIGEGAPSPYRGATRAFDRRRLDSGGSAGYSAVTSKTITMSAAMP